VTDAVILALVAAAPAVIGSLTALVVALRHTERIVTTQAQAAKDLVEIALAKQRAEAKE